MATANHVLLQRTTLTVDAATVTLSGIPTTGYTDLKLVMSARTTYAGAQSDYAIVKFNNTTTTYTGRLLIGTGTSVSSISPNGWRWFAEVNSNGQTAKTFGNAEIYIPNYSVVGVTKPYSSNSVSESNAATTEMEIFAGLWSGTDAIHTIEMASGNSGNFMAGSSFSLYGIANAATTPLAAPKADGGDIIKTDGTYWYHAFLSSGIFKPQLNLTCDVLQVAGGGAGAWGNGGGGGAGGVSYLTSQALSTSNYAVTVGAGAARITTGVEQQEANGSNSQLGSLTPAAVGGGGGATFSNLKGSAYNGKSGGSGGGGGGTDGGAVNTGGAGTAGQGNNGGSGTSQTTYNAGGGGGGAGAVGANGTGGSTPGAGGAGTNTYSAFATATSTGVSNYFAGGGGGGSNTTTGGTGGAGGGANGGYNAVGGSATANTGGGGGGGGNANVGGNGGSGIIIIRYPV